MKLFQKETLASVTSVIDGLKVLYANKLKPLEATYRFNEFASPFLTTSDFDAKPMVMLLGQYSTGKTTFIRHFLQRNYPGAHIGPEPTTDRFIVVKDLHHLEINYLPGSLQLYALQKSLMLQQTSFSSFNISIHIMLSIQSGKEERSIPGNTVSVHSELPFTSLSSFGGSFLEKFQCSEMPHPLLEQITFLDTPGVLSGEKQRTQRAYDFPSVTSWFATRSDLIFLMFDPYKLDISDEFKRVIHSLRGHDDKIRVVLNKADQVDTQQLMKVYGALMWSLGKVLNNPEVVRVYMGSFNDKPVDEAALTGSIRKELFEKEQEDIIQDLMDLPKKACDRRINEFVKRARAAKIHAYIISHLKNEMPFLIGKSQAQQELITNLHDVFAQVQRKFLLPAGDFPDVDHFRQVLSTHEIADFEQLKPKMIRAVDDMLSEDIPELLERFRYLQL